MKLYITLVAFFILAFQASPTLSGDKFGREESEADSASLKRKKINEVIPFAPLPFKPLEHSVPFTVSLQHTKFVGYYYPHICRWEITAPGNFVKDYLTNRLSSLTFLRELVIPGKSLTDDDTIPLTKLTGLVELRSCVGTITSIGAGRIARAMTRLERLDLNCHNLGDAGVAEICRITTLAELDVGACNLTSHCVNSVILLPNLTSLVLDRSNLDSADMDRLSLGLPGLRVLDVTRNSIRDEGVCSIAKNLSRLEVLSVDSNELTPNSSQYLRQITNLRRLKIGEAASVNFHLKKNLEGMKCEIEWHNWVDMSAPIPEGEPVFLIPYSNKRYPINGRSSLFKFL
ncbi:MAG: hypothetical protein K2Y18_02780 [Alphaproteobacteria bacterium]|jgi:hypothetical protein|nr:hypothetical protein [Alphaproteobacteria bacterium]